MAEEEEAGEAAPAGGSVLKKYGPLAAIVLLAQVVLAWVVIQFTMKDVQQGGDEGEPLLSETVTEGPGEEDVAKDLPYYFPDGEMLSKITFNPAGTNAERFSVISITLGLSGRTEEGGMKPEEIGADVVVTAKITEHINLIKAKALKLLRSKTIDQLNSENMPEVGKELRDALNSEVFDKIKWDEDGKKKIKVQEILFQGIIVPTCERQQMGDILSQGEIDTLLSATEDTEATEADDGGGGGGGDLGGDLGGLSGGGMSPEEGGAQRIVTSYDFKHPARVNKDQLRTLENLHDNFARLLSSTFSGAMRAVVDVDTAFVDQTTYAEFIMSLSNPSCSYQFTLGPTNGQAIIDFAMPVVFAFVDRIFGGKGSSQGVDARQLSQIEMGVIAKIVKRVVEDLEATWEPILRVEISDIELETNPEFMQITAASEIVILLAFEVNSTNASGLVSLCYPFFTLESILPRLGQQTYVRQGRQNREETIRQNRDRLSKTFMPIAAELGRGTASFQELQNLRVGDVLKMDTAIDEPTIIYIEEEPKFTGRPGRVGRKNAVQITGAIEPTSEELFKNRSRRVFHT